MYRINKLLKSDHQLYHSNDLAVLWGITNKNTLYTTVKRYVQKGILIPIHKGLYSAVPLSTLDPSSLGLAVIHRYAYVSTESILFRAGVISQPPTFHTFVTSVSQKTQVGTFSFLYRKLADRYLFNPSGLIYKDGTAMASAERAVADLLYFSPRYYFDLPGAVNWKKVKSIQKEVGYT